MNIKIDSEFKHSHLHDVAYLAKLSVPTGTHDFDREFLARNNIKRKNFDFYFEWNVLSAGIYEKKESHHYDADKVLYFAVNNAGDIIKIANKKEVEILVYSNEDNWVGLSKLKVQLFKLRTSPKKY